MKRFYLFVTGTLLIFCMDLNAQCTGGFVIFTEDFEDHGNSANGGSGRYTSDSDFFGSASDFFGRIRSDEDFYLTNSTAGNNIHVLTPYTGQNGDYFYAGEDLNDTGPLEGTQDGNPFKNIIFNDINIAGATNMCFSGLFARGENDPCGSSTYDDLDEIEIYYEIDFGGEVLGMCFNPDLECNIPMDITNEPLYYDPNCDGDGGEGTILTNTLTEFSFDIAGTGSLMNLRVYIEMDAGSEEVAVDYFRIHSDTDLPVVLSSFEGELEKNKVKLNWRTETEISNDFFEIEHSIDGKNFKNIGNVLGNGNSSQVIEYSFMHDNPSQGINYYRLVQFDINGDFSYSNIIQIDVNIVDRIELSPNPTSGLFKITNGQFESAQVNILNLNGQLVKSFTLRNQNIDISELPSGLYYMSLQFEGQQFLEKIIKE